MPYKLNPITGNLDYYETTPVETAASLLTKIETVDGAGSGLDADLLDGQSSAYYATAASDALKVAKAGDTMTGALNIDVAASTNLLNLRDGSSVPKLQVQHGTNTLTFDAYSVAAEKLSNVGFEVDLTGWSLTDLTGPIMAGLQLWYDFSDTTTLFTDDAGTTPVTTDGNSIGRVNDKSGNSRHATQTVAGAKPTYKTGIQNSLACALFDGGDQLANFSLTVATATVFVVMKRVGATAVGIGHDAADSYPLSALRLSGATYVTSTNYYNSFGDFITTSAVSTISIWKSGSSSLYINGSLKTTAGGGSLGSKTTVNSLGKRGAESMNGYILEVLYYDSELSAGDRATVESYLNTKWALY